MTRVYTIGHSTRPLEEFVELLRAQKITQLVDIRTIPKSRHNPQYEQTALERGLKENDITYVYLQDLGGLRPSGHSPLNDAWRNKSFRNYADYMQTEGFKQGIETLLNLADEQTTAIMCAEAVPWRCHRSLVADALLVRGVTVLDIMGLHNVKEHSLTSFAVVDGIDITYPKSGAAEDEA